MSLLAGERRDKNKQIEKAEAMIAELPTLKERVARIDELAFYCEEIIKDDQPDWTPKRVKAIKPFEPPRDCRRPFGLSYAAMETSSSMA